MDIERCVERLHPLPERLVAGIVEVNAIGMAVDHGPREAEILDATLELVSGGSRSCMARWAKPR